MNLQRYFQSYELYFWVWQEEGSLVALNGEEAGTIAYKAQILELLRVLSAQGWPSFGSLLLALAATAPQAPDLLRELRVNLPPDRALDKVFDFLERLGGLPEEWRQGKTRLLLIQALFEGIKPYVKPEETEAILRQYEAETWLLPVPLPYEHTVYLRDFKPFFILEQRFPDEESLLATLRGFAQKPETAPALPPNEGDADWQDQLWQHQETRPLARLRQHLEAVLDMPRLASGSAELEGGSPADLSNRGKLEQLLLSEHAFEDMVFTARLVQGETLYLRRETPPRHFKDKRVFCLDLSLWNWGLPKLLAYGLALSLNRGPQDEWIALMGEDYQVLSINSLNSLVQALQHLSLAEHSGPALKNYLAAHPPRLDKEYIFLSSLEPGQNPDFETYWQDYGRGLFDFRFILSETGSLKLQHLRLGGEPLIQDVQLPPGLLSPKADFQAQRYRGERGPKSYPLYFPGCEPCWAIASFGHKILYQIDSEGHLLRQKLGSLSSSTPLCWEMLYEHFYTERPKKPLIFYPVERSGENLAETERLMILVFNPDTAKLLVSWPLANRHIEGEFELWEETQADRFLYLAKDDLFVFSSSSMRSHYLDLQTEEEVLVWRGMERLSNKFKPAKYWLQALKEAQNFRALQPTLPWRYFLGHQVLKAVHQAGLNAQGELVLNKHALRLNSQSELRWVNKNAEIVEYAEATEPGVFQFDWGLRLSLHRSGLMYLERNGHKVYLPLSLKIPLGMTTDKGQQAGAAGFLPKHLEKTPMSVLDFYQSFMRVLLTK